MDKLYNREELIITKVTSVQNSGSSKRYFGKYKDKKSRNEKLLQDDGTDWQLDIRPVFVSKLTGGGDAGTSNDTRDSSDEGNADRNTTDDEEMATFPAALCVATLSREGEDENGTDDNVQEVKIKQEMVSDDELAPLSHFTKGSNEGLISIQPEEEDVKAEEPGSKKPTQNVVYPCVSCGITFSSVSYAEQHGRWCRGSRARVAQSAGAWKRNSLSTKATRQSSASSGQKRYTCSECGYSTDVSSHLSAHIRRHTGEKPYACDLCPYRASESCTLTRHKMAHTGAKPFPCTQCPYRASFAGDLQKHMRTHTGEKPFACERCPYRAARPGSLKEHMLTHTGAKPYACPLCAYRAVSCGHLKKHLKTHGSGGGNGGGERGSGANVFPCYLCSFNAPLLHLLTSHIQLQHPDLVSLYKPTNP